MNSAKKFRFMRMWYSYWHVESVVQRLPSCLEGICRKHCMQPERAVTPGQWVVLYDGEVCLGGGPIDSTTPLKEIVLKNI